MENENNGARVRIKFADRLKVNLRRWREITNYSGRFAEWDEVAMKVNEDTGSLADYDGHWHSWGSPLNRRSHKWVFVGFDNNGTLNIKISSWAKDSKAKIYSTDEVVAILNEVSKCINAFADAGIL